MTQLDRATPESHNSHKIEDENKVSEQDSRTLEFRAGIAAIVTVVIGIGLVIILQKVACITDSTIIVTLLIVPILVYGVVSGRLSELRAGAFIAKFNQRFNELSDKVKDTEGFVSHAIQQVSVVTTPSEMETQGIPDPEKELKKLIDQYKDIRKKQEFGWERTMNMTSIVRRMINLSPQLAQFDVYGYLDSEDRGKRLAAYAYLYANPKYVDFEKLVDSVRITIRDYEAFAQYWGLQAISKNLPQKEDKPLSPKVISRLKYFGPMLPRGTDRDYLLRTILSEIES